MSVARSILEIVREHVPPRQAPAVTLVRVRVGALSGIVPESLDFCFSVMVADTPFGRAQLAIERVPTVCQCRDCGHRFEPDDLIFFCPSCGGGRAHVLSGSELQVIEVELDEDAPGATAGDTAEGVTGSGPVAPDQRFARGRAAAGGRGGPPPQNE